MKLSKIITCLLICILFLVFDCEKFVGYQYIANPANLLARIDGKITNLFDKPHLVDSADVWFNDQSTKSDDSGNYVIDFFLGADEDRDRPVEIVARAENYFPYVNSVVIYPQDTTINIRMTYAAPIIDRYSVFPVTLDDEVIMVFQAEIIDYQGLSNLKSVWANLQYLSFSNPETRWIDVELDFISQISSTSYYYQCEFAAFHLDGYYFGEQSIYRILVLDLDGFADFSSDRVGRIPDQPLFPPNL